MISCDGWPDSYQEGNAWKPHCMNTMTNWDAWYASAKNISVRAEWLHQSGCAPSESSETPRWRITPRPGLILRVALHIALRSLFRRFFSLCQSPIVHKHSGVVDHTSEWVHWVHACIGIAAAKISPHVLSTLSSRSVGRR